MCASAMAYAAELAPPPAPGAVDSRYWWIGVALGAVIALRLVTAAYSSGRLVDPVSLVIGVLAAVAAVVGAIVLLYGE